VEDSYIGHAGDYPEVVKNRTIAWQRLKDDLKDIKKLQTFCM
jgi:hypothetical protein